MHNLTADGMLCVMEYIYTNEINITIDDVENILQMSDYLNMRDLLDACAT